jgi:hypothetical protein
MILPSTASRSPYSSVNASMFLPGTGRGTGAAGGGGATPAPCSMVLEENGYQMLRLSAADRVKAPRLAASGLTPPLHRFAVPLPVAGEEL